MKKKNVLLKEHKRFFEKIKNRIFTNPVFFVYLTSLLNQLGIFNKKSLSLSCNFKIGYMEKFNFWKCVKTSFLMLGLSSIVLSSCNKGDEPEGDTPEAPLDTVKTILSDGFTASYPLDFPLKAYPSKNPLKISNLGEDKHVDEFYVFITYDSTSVNEDSTLYTTSIEYFKLTNPSTTSEKEVDYIVDELKTDFYPADVAEVITDEKTTFAGYSAHKLVVSKKGKYMEHYVFYSSSLKKVFIVLISMLETDYKTRRDELYRIASTFKVK